jgi:hypothetical protein
MYADCHYPIEFEIQDTTDTDRSALYFDMHLEIDSEGRVRTKLYDKRELSMYMLQYSSSTCKWSIYLSISLEMPVQILYFKLNGIVAINESPNLELFSERTSSI